MNEGKSRREPRKDWRESVTVKILGNEYTGQANFEDLGGGMCSFNISYADQFRQDSGIYRRDDPQIALWVKAEMKKLVLKSRKA